MPKGYIHKIWLIMRLTTVLLIAVFMQVSAASLAQKLTFKNKNATLEQIFNQITKQTGYNVLWPGSKLDVKITINANFDAASLQEVMEKSLTALPMTFTIEDKTILIKEKTPSFLDKVRNVIQNLVQNIDVRGIVVDEKGLPLPGATVTVKGTGRKVIANGKGEFYLPGVEEKVVLVISFLGYERIEVKAAKDMGAIKLSLAEGKLDEVEVVSTGYQTLPKERVTGSFVLIDSALLNRKLGSNILERLDGVASGLIFNKNKGGFGNNTPDISIRGRSTISSSAEPLIILDNFPYDGDISNINPQDVKSISILKDAAAASIWGSRAGNGVIVITTYKGNFNKKPTVSFNTNLTVGNKPDLYFKEQLSSKQFVGVEHFLFDKGSYDPIINNGYGSLSPAIEIMLLNRKGTITSQRKADMLDSLSKYDSRDDMDKYYYRNSINQQYQLSVNGGGQNNKYYISFGYDKNLANLVTKSTDRLTLNANNTVSLLNNRLELQTGVLFSLNNSKTNGINYQFLYPYENIADENGNALSVTKGTLRIPYVDTVGKGKLLDWNFKPLEEIQNPYSSNVSKLTDYRINLGASYTIISNLKFSLNYSYNKGINENTDYNTLDSYYTRNLINTYSQVSELTGVVKYPFPVGDIKTKDMNTYYSHYGRTQLSYDKSFSEDHNLNAIVGFEVKDYNSSTSGLTLYGYNKETGIHGNSTINPTIFYPEMYGSNSSKILLGIYDGGAIDRYRSYYFNASYTYKSKYILSASARKDESNLFGVKPNQKGVPLWSAGVAWNLSSESFYNAEILPSLRLRATYGYNGNVNKSVSAYLTAEANGITNSWGRQFLNIINPPNPSLKWEKVKNINLGIDFSARKNIVSGSIEFWIKDGIDLIGKSPNTPQTGVVTYTGNSANMHSKGIDLILNTRNINNSHLKWYTNLLLNYNTDKITSYKVKPIGNMNIVSSNYMQPLEGYSYYSIFSFPWMGLDNQGNPQSMLNGSISKEYSAISSSNNPKELVYNGTSTPKIYGSLMNTISWNLLELSFNIVYKFNYVFRRNSLSNYTLYSNPNGAEFFQQSDYELRWQNPGDELNTSVPSLMYPASSVRDAIYSRSSILIEKADHIRLQDIRLNYSLSKTKLKSLPFSNLNFYAYTSNLGIIWKATKYKIDPDYPTGLPMPKVFSIGVKADF